MDILSPLLNNKVNHVEQDLKLVVHQLSLLQAFVRLKFQEEFKTFADEYETSGVGLFGQTQPATATSSTARQEERLHRQIQKQSEANESSSKLTFIAPSVSVSTVKVVPHESTSASPSSITITSVRGSSTQTFDSENETFETVELPHYDNETFEVEDANEFRPFEQTEVPATFCVDQKLSPENRLTDAEGKDPLATSASVALPVFRPRESKSGWKSPIGKNSSFHSTKVPPKTPKVQQNRAQVKIAKTASQYSSKLKCLDSKCNDKTFRNPYLLRQHHIALKCPRCPDKSFYHKDGLQSHMRMHSRMDSIQLYD